MDLLPFTLLVHQSTKKEREEIIHILIHHGVDVNSTTDDGTTPLMRASVDGNFTLLHSLLYYNADATLKTIHKRGVFHFLTLRKKIRTEIDSMIKLLLEKGGDIEGEDIHGSTPFFNAINNCNVDIIKFGFSMLSTHRNFFNINNDRTRSINNNNNLGKGKEVYL